MPKQPIVIGSIVCSVWHIGRCHMLLLINATCCIFNATNFIVANCSLHIFQVSGFWIVGQKKNYTACLILSFTEKRCPTLTMPANGGFKCVDGAYFNSRCEYYCSPGYTLKGERTVTCMDNKAWSGRPASCVGKKISQASGGPSLERSNGSLLL